MFGSVHGAAGSFYIKKMARYKVQLQIIDLNFLFDFRGLADMNGDGQMDINEFSIACKLITNKLKGKPIHIIMQYLAISIILF